MIGVKRDLYKMVVNPPIHWTCEGGGGGGGGN